ncbi:MAG: delta-60 repeat domain-containing protein [Polyangiaceae bacterium]|nr:delta-60 repeat domain-containing protein [Polyangiaceae bacterium]
MMKISTTGWLLVALGCVASCGGSFGDAPGSGSSGSGSPDGGGGSGQTNGGTDSDGGVLDGGVITPGPEAFSFDPAPDRVYVRQGQTTKVPITVTRTRTPGSDIQVIVTGAPAGVTPAPFIIPSGSNTGDLPITIGALPQGDLQGMLTLEGSAGGTAMATNNYKLSVSGNRGSPDVTFGTNGTGIIEDTTDYYSINSVTPPQNDGKILISTTKSYDQTTGQYTSAVIRLNANGLVDSTLTDTSIQKILGLLEYKGVTADANGRIVVMSAPGTITRYKANGVLDATLFNTKSPIYAVFAGPNDSIYVGGLTPFLQISATGQGIMASCPGFSLNGNTMITNMSLLPTGALAFTIGAYLSNGLGVGRYTDPSNCTLDENYGTNGGVWYSPDWRGFADALFETDGSVDLLPGKANTNPRIYSLVRIDPTGNPTTIMDLPLDVGSGGGITRAPDGRYIVAGHQSTSTTSMDVAYYNYDNTDFTPDMTIGTQGIVNISIPKSTTLTNLTTGVGLRAVYTPDGSRTVVVGSIQGTNAAGTPVQHFVVARIWN